MVESMTITATPVALHSASQFDAFISDQELPIMVDFTASWCGPCRQLAPIVEKMAAEKAGTLAVATVDIDEVPGLAARYRVASVPFLGLFRNGRLVAHSVGLMPAAQIEQALGI